MGAGMTFASFFFTVVGIDRVRTFALIDRIQLGVCFLRRYKKKVRYSLPNSVDARMRCPRVVRAFFLVILYLIACGMSCLIRDLVVFCVLSPRCELGQ